MFQFRRFPSYTYLIQYRIPCGGFPHSEISGSMLICSSPKLIAACHVLHRLLMPRHSPCALISLTIFQSNQLEKSIWFSISWIMQTHKILEVFRLAKIVSFYPKKIIYPLLLPSHNCIIIHNVQFSRCTWVSKKLNETSVITEISFNSFKKESGGPRTRFSAEKPRRLQQSTGLLPRAAFRVHFGALASWTQLSRSWPRFKTY